MYTLYIISLLITAFGIGWAASATTINLAEGYISSFYWITGSVIALIGLILSFVATVTLKKEKNKNGSK